MKVLLLSVAFWTGITGRGSSGAIHDAFFPEMAVAT
jgi:hypothetical protein